MNNENQRRVEEPDFTDDDMEIIDEVWKKIEAEEKAKQAKQAKDGDSQ